MVTLYPFDKIRDIRAIRKRNSEFKLNNKKNILAKADQVLRAREQQLEEHRQQRLQKEQSLYGEIIRKPMSLNEFEHFQLEIGYMRDTEANHVDKVQQAEKEKETATQQVDEALRVFNLRNREQLKIDEHYTEWSMNTSVEENRRVENELDEIGQLVNSSNKQSE